MQAHLFRDYGVDRRRDRRRNAFNLFGVDRTYVNGALTQTVNVSAVRENVEITKDAVHEMWNPRYRDRGYRSRFDIGGPFESVKVEWSFPKSGTGAGNPPGSYVRRKYDGPIIAQPPTLYPQNLEDPTVLQYTTAVLDPLNHRWGLGGQAIAACRPAQPEAAFGQTMVELFREGIPSIFQRFDIKDVVGTARGAGGNYLNVEFGWKPLVADLKDAARVFLHHQEILDDLYRNNGKPMRRRYSFPEVRTDSIVSDNIFPWPTLTSSHWTQSHRTVRTELRKKTWFAGEFVYHLPDRKSDFGELKVKMRHLLGADLTPELLWNIAPWTWLLDWFSSFGDLFANISAITSDDLVLRYGYLMQEAVERKTYTHHNVKTLGYGQVLPTVSGSTLITARSRIRASPYGFGFTDSDLTSRQWAILTALFTSRGSGNSQRRLGTS